MCACKRQIGIFERNGWECGRVRELKNSKIIRSIGLIDGEVSESRDCFCRMLIIVCFASSQRGSFVIGEKSIFKKGYILLEMIFLTSIIGIHNCFFLQKISVWICVYIDLYFKTCSSDCNRLRLVFFIFTFVIEEE